MRLGRARVGTVTPAGNHIERLDQALQVTSREMGYALEWSESEELIIDRACAAADRGEQLERIYDEHLVAGDEPGVLVKLSAEIRACERQVVYLTGKVSLGLLPGKSGRRVRAARARWDRRDAAWAAAARDANDPALAAKVWAEAARRFPDIPRGHIELGIALRDAGRLDRVGRRWSSPRGSAGDAGAAGSDSYRGNRLAGPGRV